MRRWYYDTAAQVGLLVEAGLGGMTRIVKGRTMTTAEAKSLDARIDADDDCAGKFAQHVGEEALAGNVSFPRLAEWK